MGVAKLIEIDGKVKSITEWAKFHGLPPTTVQYRFRQGWTTEDALSRRSKKHYLTAHGETRTLTSWAKRAGIQTDTLTYRLRHGWTPEQAVSPNRKRGPGVTAFGKTLSLQGWERETGIRWTTIRRRIVVNGLAPEVALTLVVSKTKPRGNR